ncbi:MAG: AAA family ATPase [Capsulimonadaceae bacterium]
MINRVTLENYRSIAHADVELGPLTVLVGRNGAGKSTFLDAMRLIHDALRFNLEEAIDLRGGMAAIRRWTPNGKAANLRIRLQADWNEHEGLHELVLTPISYGGYKVLHESAVSRYPMAIGSSPEDPQYDVHVETMEVDHGRLLSGWPDPDSRSRQAEITIDPRSLQLSSQTGHNQGLSELRRHLQQTAFYALYPNKLRERKQELGRQRFLDEHGENFASTILYLIKREWRSDLIAGMQRLVGDILDVRVRPSGGYLVVELKHESQSRKEKWLNLSQESDGTVRMLGLLVAIYQEPAPSLIAIEEPELTIHPGALAVLADILREASGRTQVMLTTQSPDLVSYFQADEIRVVERIDGDTQIGPIDETQRAAMEQHLFTGGELLRIEGLRRQQPVGGTASA